MQRLLRMWTKRIALALAAFVALNAVIVGGFVLMDALTPVVLPALPEAPRFVAPSIAPSIAPPADPAPASAGDSADFLVAVGLFASRERADEIVDALAQAGLPAMQRTVDLRRQQAQQIVLGPFFSRADAITALQRLQALGGYDDARVIAQ